MDAFAGLAMRLYTDASGCWLAQTVESEIRRRFGRRHST
ncbi:hypothetical protein SynMVIR181_00935 [Synechococcus sp. MVIR-18-1]|nr:hypothetical protein SynMVIR181_00935 [Synechococcus sp. MVIR-18-1]